MPYVRLPGGIVAHVKMARSPRRRCACGRWAEKQCDAPKGAGTCSRYICAHCALHVEPDTDYCAAHRYLVDDPPPVQGVLL